MLVGDNRLPGRKGVARTADDRLRGAMIEDILCQGSTRLPSALAGLAQQRIAPFAERGLARIDGDRLVLEPGGEPYARSIAAVFDIYREGAGQFSSAV